MKSLRNKVNTGAVKAVGFSVLFSLIAAGAEAGRRDWQAEQAERDALYVNQTFNIQALQQLLERNTAIDSIEDLIRARPQTYRDQYTLIQKSQSLQGASASEPRVALIGSTKAAVPSNPALRTRLDNAIFKEDTLTLTFKTNPGLKGARGVTHDRVELMDFDHEQGVFTFFELSFRETPGGARYQISEPNPPRCLSCHLGTQNPANPAVAGLATPRPIWRFRYPDWTANNSDIFGDDKGAGSRLRQGWAEHYAARDKNARIPLLSPLADTYGAASDYYPTPTINQAVDAKLEWYNAIRVAKLLSRSPDFTRYQFAIYGALKACRNVDQFLPKEIRSQHKPSLADYITATVQNIDSRSNIMTSTQKRAIGSIRYLFEGRGMNINHFWMDFQPMTGGAKAGDGAIYYAESAFSHRAADKVGGPESDYEKQSRYERSRAFEEVYFGSSYAIAQYLPTADQIRGYREPEVDCERLKQASLAAFGAPKVADQGPPKPPSIKPSGKELPAEIKSIIQANCVSCHNPSTKIGQVYGDFLDHKVLKENFVTDGKHAGSSILWERVRSGQMPPREAGGKLSQAELDTIKAWIDRGASAAN